MQSAAAVCKKRICYYGGSFDPPTYGHMIAAAAVAACGAADEVWISPCGGEAASAAAASGECAASEGQSPRPLPEAAAAASSSAVAAAAAVLNGDASTSCSTLPDEGEAHADSSVNPLFRPDKKVKSSPQARLAMAHLAVNHFFGPAETRRVPVKVFDREANTRGYTPTLRLLLQLAAEEEQQQQQQRQKGEPQQQAQTEYILLVGEDVVPDLPRWHGGEKLMENYSFLILPRSTPQHHLPKLLPHIRSCNSQSSISTQNPPAAAEAENGGAAAAAATAMRASAAAAAEMKERVAAVLKRMPRYAYLEQVCLERGVPYFHWPCSSTFARQVLRYSRSDAAAAREAVSLVSPPVLAYIEEHGLYTEE